MEETIHINRPHKARAKVGAWARDNLIQAADAYYCSSKVVLLPWNSHEEQSQNTGVRRKIGGREVATKTLEKIESVQGSYWDKKEVKMEHRSGKTEKKKSMTALLVTKEKEKQLQDRELRDKLY